MKIIFVCGPAFSGKSTYIQKHYPDATIVDLGSFVESVNEAETNEEIELMGANIETYCHEEFKNLVSFAREDEVLVLEHPLLRKEERLSYLEAVRSVTGCPVDCIMIAPETSVVEKALKKQAQLVTVYVYEKRIMETPTVDEGFASVTIVHPEFEE